MISLTEQWKKHQPLARVLEDNIIINIGRDIEHPMLDAHLIENVDILMYTKAWLLRVKEIKFQAWDKPEASFPISDLKPGTYKAQAKCNLHGTWDDDFVI
jgi:desulfoferrodoxin (superoxide reductase-like protein)